VIDPNDDIDVVSTILVLDEDGNTYPGTWEGSNPITIDVPEGTYDIYTDFSVSGGFTNYIIIKELVDISTATTVDIDLTEATNYVSVSAYNENGALLEPGIIDPNTGIPSTIFLRGISIFYLQITGLVIFIIGMPLLKKSRYGIFTSTMSVTVIL